jgi:molybdopterin synthase sulfur carrier subunit
LREFTGGLAKVSLELSPSVLDEALKALWARHPGIRDRMTTEQGEIRQHINVFVGSEDIRYTGGLATPTMDGCEISIVPAVSGGATAWCLPPVAVLVLS